MKSPAERLDPTRDRTETPPRSTRWIVAGNPRRHRTVRAAQTRPKERVLGPAGMRSGLLLDELDPVEHLLDEPVRELSGV